MRKVECKKLWRWVLKLRCRRCGKKETFYIGHRNDVPTYEINGWTFWRLTYPNGMPHIRKTELCPICSALERGKQTSNGYSM
jgi:hypothetical protein